MREYRQISRCPDVGVHQTSNFYCHAPIATLTSVAAGIGTLSVYAFSQPSDSLDAWGYGRANYFGSAQSVMMTCELFCSEKKCRPKVLSNQFVLLLNNGRTVTVSLLATTPLLDNCWSAVNLGY